MDGLQAPGVGDQVLHHLPVHQGLAAEEVHLQVPAGAGVCHQKVQGLLAHLKGHEGPLALVFALAGKAVGAAQVAGVGHVETQGLDDVGVVLVVGGHGGVGVGGEKLVVLLQRCHVVDAGPDLLLGDVGTVGVVGQDAPADLVRGVVGVEGDDVIRHLVHQMDRTAAGVQDDVVAVQLVLMYHKCDPSAG